MGWVIFGAFFLVGWGLICIVGKDFLWELKEASNSRQGLASERTEDWENSTTIGGVFSIVMGVGLGLFVLTVAAGAGRSATPTPAGGGYTYATTIAERAATGTVAAEATGTAIAAAPPPGPAGPLYEVEAVIGGESIRLVGAGETLTVTAIGLAPPRRVGECFGRESLDEARALLEGRRVRIARDPRFPDRRGGGAAYIWTEDGTFYNLAMLEGGYAFLAKPDAPYAYQEGFAAAERAARDGGRGLWAAEGCAGRLSGPPPGSRTPAPGATATRGTPTVPR